MRTEPRQLDTAVGVGCDKKWLVLLEAASSHGAVDAQRHGELGRRFANSTAGLVFVSCFQSRSEMLK